MDRNMTERDVAVIFGSQTLRQNSFVRLGMIEYDFWTLGGILCLFQLKCYFKNLRTLCRVSLQRHPSTPTVVIWVQL